MEMEREERAKSIEWPIGKEEKTELQDVVIVCEIEKGQRKDCF